VALAGTEISVPAGTVTPLENVKGRNARRVTETGKNKSASRTRENGEEIRLTDGETINPLGLPKETVDLVHLVYPSFRPTFFFNHRVDLLAERFDIFRICKEAVQYLRERLLTCNDYDCIIRRNGMSSLAKDAG
jgi:hypothetical protein